MKTVTVEEVLDWGDICDPERVERIGAAWERWSALDILGLDEPAADLLWVVLRPELVNDRVLRLFACDCAEQALTTARRSGHETDERSWNAVEVSRRFADGAASPEELSAAWAAARAAALDSAGYAARNAACNTSRDAAWAAAREATWVAGCEWQKSRLIELLKAEVKDA